MFKVNGVKVPEGPSGSLMTINLISDMTVDLGKDSLKEMSLSMADVSEQQPTASAQVRVSHGHNGLICLTSGYHHTKYFIQHTNANFVT